jgi:hypothetical protein
MWRTTIVEGEFVGMRKGLPQLRRTAGFRAIRAV